MDTVTLLHYQIPRFVNPLAEDYVALKVKVRPAVSGTCYVWYEQDNRWQQQEMSLFARKKGSLYYQTIVHVPQKRLSYYFEYDLPDGRRTFLGKGTRNRLPGLELFDYSWTNEDVFNVPSWVPDSIFYQIFPERFFNGDPGNDPPGTLPWGSARPTRTNFFGGDLQGIMEKIPYLVELGVTAIWLNPIFASVSNHKYDTYNYYLIDPHFGNLALFKELVARLHAHGIRVILDAVFNHTGDEFWAFQDVVERGPESPYWDWYYIYDYPIRREPIPNYACWWNFPDLPKLKVTNPAVRQYLLEVAAFWTRTGIDGWRLDVPNELEPSFWVEFRRVVKNINPEAYIVGEIWENARPWLRGDMFDGVMNYVLRDLVIKFFARRELSVSAFDYRLGLLRLRYREQAGSCLLNLLGSHDTERVITVFSGGRDYLSGIEKLKPALVFQMTYMGAPMIYYGDEVGMVGAADPDCRAPMEWDGERQDRSLWQLYRKLIFLRRHWAALRHGRWETVLVDDVRWIYGYVRKISSELVLAVLNVGKEPQAVNVDVKKYGLNSGLVRDYLSGQSYCLPGGHICIPYLPPGGSLIFLFREGNNYHLWN